MKSKVFKAGNYVWECKTSPTPNSIGASVEVSYLKHEIKEVKKRWAKEGMPSGYYYVFPINYISNAAREELETFKSQYRGQVDIGYYDCDQVQKLIGNCLKLGTMQDLINYIQKVRGN
jgi:hypothetical protein